MHTGMKQRQNSFFSRNLETCLEKVALILLVSRQDSVANLALTL